MTIQAGILVAGPAATGRGLVLGAPISFWGGVDPASGRIADVRHPDHGRMITGQVLCLPGTIGSSSASAVLLELVAAGLAPAALILHQPDAILLLGLIVAREMGLVPPLALRLDRAHFPVLDGRILHVSARGAIDPRPAARDDPGSGPDAHPPQPDA